MATRCFAVIGTSSVDGGRLPLAALEVLSRIPSVLSILDGSRRHAEQSPEDVWEDSTLRGTLGLPVQGPTGAAVCRGVIDSGFGGGARVR